jgi:hypothetical protein
MILKITNNRTVTISPNKRAERILRFICVRVA